MSAGGHMPPGIADRSREKQLTHDYRHRSSVQSGEQLHVGPPKNPAPAPKRFALVRLWGWLARRWTGD
jgi:hypothetical protein